MTATTRRRPSSSWTTCWRSFPSGSSASRPTFILGSALRVRVLVSWRDEASQGRRPPVCRYEPIGAFGTPCLLIAAPGGAHAVGVDGPVRNLATPAGGAGGDP